MNKPTEQSNPLTWRDLVPDVDTLQVGDRMWYEDTGFDYFHEKSAAINRVYNFENHGLVQRMYASPVDVATLTEQANAWFAVVEALGKVDERWHDYQGTGQESAEGQ